MLLAEFEANMRAVSSVLPVLGRICREERWRCEDIWGTVVSVGITIVCLLVSQTMSTVTEPDNVTPWMPFAFESTLVWILSYDCVAQ